MNDLQIPRCIIFESRLGVDRPVEGRALANRRSHLPLRHILLPHDASKLVTEAHHNMTRYIEEINQIPCVKREVAMSFGKQYVDGPRCRAVDACEPSSVFDRRKHTGYGGRRHEPLAQAHE